MGSTYQTVLATGDLDGVRRALAESRQKAVIIPVAERRWAVIPRGESGYAETATLARLMSLRAGEYAARFEMYDSDALLVEILHRGATVHDYVSELRFVIEDWDDDDNEILVDLRGNVYHDLEEVPRGPYGADPSAFAPLGVGTVDMAGLDAALRRPQLMAESQHHDAMHALNVDPRPLQMTYEQARKSRLGV
ncbi:hypothetical protein Aca07nite_24960 [Actinoplanes capillaceus]|uniref:Uncharacterized protein n=1 Tax=Actinoplanes campanulatus TaxID=113559 RepID=A0ABQ3WG32_9ACTN|nr:hypothetical protein [Actinoplanes capillaceus]GID45221.1 hypothetical protein Aca07nite_24960 [Actinoplanes capillaceus]